MVEAKIPYLFPSTTGGIECFDEFFESGMEENVSPFLTPKSRKWGVNLPLKSSFIGAFCLFFGFIFSFFPSQSSLTHLFLLLTYFFAGIPALISAVEDLCNLEVNIDVLMTLAAFFSILIGSSMEGALLLVLFSFSGSMEEAVRSKAKGAIHSLKKIAPGIGFVVQPDGSLVERSVKDIQVKEKIHVKAGQVIPLDGRVIEGSSSINLSHITGESLPLSRTVGDTVPAGARNFDGALTLEVTHTSGDSTLARIIQLIIQAQESKPKLQRWLDKVTNGYAITIISLSSIFALILPLLFSIPYLGQEGSIYRALTFLIAASPCALVIAIPVAYLSAISVCARQGILLKGGVILDALAKCKTVVLDKTGTITTGELECIGLDTFNSDEEEMTSLALALERSAVHPIAQAIVKYAKKNQITPAFITDFQSVAGYGLKGHYQGKEVCIGHGTWILPHLPEEKQQVIKEKIKEIQEKGELFTLLKFKEGAAIFRFRDTLRAHSKKTVDSLKKKWGMRVVMLTGDHQKSAALVAKEVGVTEYYAELRPEDKVEYISRNDNLAMVGDGMNDAPALARATVGISMGKRGSATAIDASDIVLLQDKIELLEWLIKKATQVGRIVKQNVSIAASAIFLVTLPALIGYIPLWLAVILHEGGTVIVALNALRLLKK
ncbi:MAG: cation-translocating P-type ATPase [Chlamydiales bacterium]